MASLVLGVLIATVATWGYIYYNSFFESSKDARLATHTLPLTAKVGGKVVKFLVNESQTVREGDPLVQLDAREFQAALDERQSALDRSEDRLKGGWQSLEKLRQKAATGDAAAKSQYEGARTWLVRLQSKTHELRESVAQAKEQVKATTITAPSDGHIGQKAVEVGATVSAGQPVLHFVGTGLPWSIANFKEEQLDKMKIGQNAEIIVPSLGKVLIGKVETLPARTNPVVVRSEFERFLRRFMEGGPRVPVRISVDAKSVGKDVNRLVNGTPAEVKVYIK